MSFRGLVVTLVLGTSFMVARAEQQRLYLDELIAETLHHNPEILAAEQRYEGTRQRPRREGSLPDPTLSPGYSSVANPWPGAGLGVWQVSHAGLMLSREFPFPGKRRLRSEIALKEAEAEFQQYQLVQLSVISRLKQAYHQLQYAYAAIDVLTHNRELLRKFVTVTTAPYIVIRGAQEAEFAILETRILRMEQDKRSREAEINSLLNRAPDSPLARPVETEPPQLRATLGELLAEAHRNAPVLRREQKDTERSGLALNLARKDYYPDYTISAGYFNMGRMPGLYEFRVNLRLPVYFWRKQRPAVAEQVYSLSQAQRNYEAANRALEFRIKNEHLRVETSIQLAKMYADTVLPKARLAVESSLAAYQGGAADIMPLLANFMTLVDYELGYQEELLSCYLALTRLEELTGLSPLS